MNVLFTKKNNKNKIEELKTKVQISSSLLISSSYFRVVPEKQYFGLRLPHYEIRHARIMEHTHTEHAKDQDDDGEKNE